MPRIPVTLVNYPAIQGDSGIGFGVYWCFGQKRGILIARRMMTKRPMLETAAHEIAHYAQDVGAIAATPGMNAEEQAETEAKKLLDAWGAGNRLVKTYPPKNRKFALFCLP